MASSYFYISILLLLSTSFASSLSPVICHAGDSTALLQFKQSFVVDNLASPYPFAHPKVLSWNLQTDCCSWEGVECDENDGHVIGLDLSGSCLFGSINSSSSLFSLKHLQRLGLGGNHFNNSHIPPALVNLSPTLTYLDLSSSHFAGQIPSEISALSKLSVLNLGFNSDSSGTGLLQLKPSTFTSLVQNLTSLEALVLSYVDISASAVPHALANLSSLLHINLRSCNLAGEFPSSVFMLPRLQYLSIRYNQITGHLPLFNSSSLEVFKVGQTSLSGELPPYSIQNLPSLTEFDIGNCSFSGPIPSSFGNLTNLTYLDVSMNDLEGEFPSNVFLLPHLKFLGIWYNLQITGHLPQFNSSSLESLQLGKTNFSGELPHDSIQNLPSLRDFGIASCSFSGQIPSSFGNLTNLTHLDVSFNNLTVGDLSWFTYLTNLQWLSLIGVNFSGEIPHSLSRLDKLEQLYMQSCQLSGRIPFWIGNLTQLTVLNLGGNLLQGPIPKSISQLVNLRMFRIRKNNLSGRLEAALFQRMKSLIFLDIGYNNFNGHIPIPPPSTKLYIGGNNSLTGEISSVFCNLDSLVILDLSHNDLSGELPPCIANLTHLSILNLNDNTFSGTIPHMCTNGSSKLALLDFSENQLQGELPKSLASCSMLRKLDVGHNRIEDTFPLWMGRLHTLQLLSLRSNRFHGSIQRFASMSSTEFLNLSIIDISNNGFSGDLPSALFRNWKRMEKTTSLVQFASMEIDEIFIDPSNYDKPDIDKFSMELANKGNELQYAKIPNGFAGVDFSSNNFSGVIPEYIGKMNGLYMLNLSHNHLTGDIPSSFANLIVLESLDLSHNKLSGKIPQELAQLTSLAVLDVSHNNLTGQVPRGKQFDTFTDSSFDGNVGLCGDYLITKKCKIPHPPSPMHVCFEDCEGVESSLLDKSDWIVAVIGSAGGLVVGFVMGNELMARKPEWFVKVFGSKMQPKRRNRRN